MCVYIYQEIIFQCYQLVGSLRSVPESLHLLSIFKTLQGDLQDIQTLITMRLSSPVLSCASWISNFRHGLVLESRVSLVVENGQNVRRRKLRRPFPLCLLLPAQYQASAAQRVTCEWYPDIPNGVSFAHCAYVLSVRFCGDPRSTFCEPGCKDAYSSCSHYSVVPCTLSNQALPLCALRNLQLLHQHYRCQYPEWCRHQYHRQPHRKGFVQGQRIDWTASTISSRINYIFSNWASGKMVVWTLSWERRLVHPTVPVA